jgi:tetratricopeptide (TPR) repeat protein
MELLVLSFFSALAVVAMAVAGNNSTIVFDPIKVPPEWQNRGYTSDVVSNRLTDAIRRMNEEAGTFKRRRGVRLGSDKTVTQELGRYLGLSAPIWIMRKELGLIEYTVGGEIVLADKDTGMYQFLLRSSNFSADQHSGDRSSTDVHVLTAAACGTLDRPADLIQLGAEEALRVIGPYILASYYFDREEDAYYSLRNPEADGMRQRLKLLHTPLEAVIPDGADEPNPNVGDKTYKDGNCGGRVKYGAPFHQTVEAIKHSLATMPEAERKWPYDLWGLVHLVKDEYELAIEKFEAAIAIDPRFEVAIHNWGLALAAQGNYRAAIYKYQEAVAAGGMGLPGVYNGWAIALGKLGYTAEAISIFQIVLKMDPKYADAYHKLGELYETLGNTKKANGYYREAVALDPTGEGFKADFNRTRETLAH